VEFAAKHVHDTVASEVGRSCAGGHPLEASAIARGGEEEVGHLTEVDAGGTRWKPRKMVWNRGIAATVVIY